jgi:hypothetical protein
MKQYARFAKCKDPTMTPFGSKKDADLFSKNVEDAERSCTAAERQAFGKTMLKIIKNEKDMTRKENEKNVLKKLNKLRF